MISVKFGSHNDRPNFIEFILMESDARLILDANTLVGVCEKDYFDNHQKATKGTHLITKSGNIFWVKTKYDIMKQIIMKRKK